MCAVACGALYHLSSPTGACAPLVAKGICNSLVAALRWHAGESEVAYAVGRCCTNLLVQPELGPKVNPAAAAALLAAGIAEPLLDAVSRCSDADKVIKAAFAPLSLLATTPSGAAALLAAAAGEKCVALLRRHTESTRTCTEACQFVAALLQTSRYNAATDSRTRKAAISSRWVVDAAGLALGALRRFEANEAVVQACFDALDELYEVPAALRALIEAGAAETVIASCRRHGDHGDVRHRHALLRLVQNCAKNEDGRRQVDAAGGVPALIKLLQEHSPDAALASDVLHVLAHFFGRCSKAAASAAVAAVLLEEALAAMRRFPGAANVNRGAARLLASLASAAPTAAASRTGAVLLPALLIAAAPASGAAAASASEAAAMCSSAIASVTLQQADCTAALQSMAAEGAAGTPADARASAVALAEALLATLGASPVSGKAEAAAQPAADIPASEVIARVAVARGACTALRNLAAAYPVEVMGAGAAKAMVAVLCEHPLAVDHGVAAAACAALRNLAALPELRAAVSGCGADFAAGLALRACDFAAGLASGTAVVLAALGCMCALSFEPASRFGMAFSGCGHAAGSVLSSGLAANADVAWIACGLLSNLTSPAPGGGPCVCLGRLCDGADSGRVILRALRLHVADARVFRAACAALAHMAMQEATRKTLLADGAQAAIAEVSAGLEATGKLSEAAAACRDSLLSSLSS